MHLRKKKFMNTGETNNNTFWNRLPKPFFAMAPMADVTDCVFREIISKYSRHGEVGGGPDVFWTEFVSTDGLALGGRDALLVDLKFNPEIERPIVAQLFGSNIETMEKAAALCQELGFDGIDINMGCPDKSIEKQGAGAAMIKNPKRAREIIQAAKRGAPNLPISVKTRVGYNKVEIEEWIPQILEEGVAALTVHARTRKEMSLVPARWEHVAEVVRMRDAMGLDTKIIGNGDVKTVVEGKMLAEQTGCDGIMIGRGIFGTPWLFDTTRQEPTLRERFAILIEHTKRYEAVLGGLKNFSIMKKHYKAYVNGFDGAKELRVELMDAPDAKTIEGIVHRFLNEHKEVI